jgi:hypothetical protein
MSCPKTGHRADATDRRPGHNESMTCSRFQASAPVAGDDPVLGSTAPRCGPDRSGCWWQTTTSHAGPGMRGQMRPFHLRIRHRVLVPGGGHRLPGGPRSRLPVAGLNSWPRRAARTSRMVAVGQRQGNERPGLVATGYPAADLEHPPAGPAPIAKTRTSNELINIPPLEATETSRFHLIT